MTCRQPTVAPALAMTVVFQTRQPVPPLRDRVPHPATPIVPFPPEPGLISSCISAILIAGDAIRSGTGRLPKCLQQ